MYTILIGEDNQLVATVTERIMQRSKLVDNLHFLVDQEYKGHDMSKFTAVLEYVLPVSREYHTVNLELSLELYKEKLEYKLPFDTGLTKEAGDIEMQVTFVCVELQEDGSNIQYVRKTSPIKVKILPITAWSDIIADNALTAIDQRLIQADALVNSLNSMAQSLYENKADSLVYSENMLQLTSAGNKIGDAVEIRSYTIDPVQEADGSMRVVEF